MTSRFTLALFAALAASGATALAAGPGAGIGIGVGAQGSIGAGVPPVAVPHVGAPPAGVPPVSVPKPAVAPANANANGHAQTTVTIAAPVLHGTVTSVSADTVNVKLSDGTTQTYSVAAQVASQLRSDVNKTITFRAQNNTLSLVGVGEPPLHGTLIAMNGTSARIKLADGAVHTYTVSAKQAAWLKTHAGKRVVFWTNADGTVEFNQNNRAH